MVASADAVTAKAAKPMPDQVAEALLQADDDSFELRWRSMSEDERAELPEGDRAQCIARYRNLTPHVDATVARFRKREAGVPPELRGVTFEDLDVEPHKGNGAHRPVRTSTEFEPEKPAAPDRERKLSKRANQLPRVWLDDATVPSRARGPVKGLIGPGDFVIVYGPSGSGKTAVAIGLAGHVAAGVPWRALRTTSSLVVYVAAEAGRSILSRFVAWRDRHVGDAHEGRVALAIVTRGVNLLLPVEVEELVVQLREIAAEASASLGLVVFDTLSRSMPGGDENTAQDMTKVIGVADRLRDEFGAATLLVHHSGKDGAKGARGHSALVAAADTVIGVADHVATVEKVRDGIAGQTFPFELEVIDLGADEDGDRITTCLAIEATGAAANPQKTARPPPKGMAALALQALEEAIGESGALMPGTSTIPNGVRAVKIDQWRARFYLRHGEAKGDDTARKAFSRARAALVGVVDVSDPYVWIRR